MNSVTSHNSSAVEWTEHRRSVPVNQLPVDIPPSATVWYCATAEVSAGTIGVTVYHDDFNQFHIVRQHDEEMKKVDEVGNRDNAEDAWEQLKTQLENEYTD